MAGRLTLDGGNWSSGVAKLIVTFSIDSSLSRSAASVASRSCSIRGSGLSDRRPPGCLPARLGALVSPGAQHLPVTSDAVGLWASRDRPASHREGARRVEPSAQNRRSSSKQQLSAVRVSSGARRLPAPRTSARPSPAASASHHAARPPARLRQPPRPTRRRAGSPARPVSAGRPAEAARRSRRRSVASRRPIGSPSRWSAESAGPAASSLAGPSRRLMASGSERSAPSTRGSDRPSARRRRTAPARSVQELDGAGARRRIYEACGCTNGRGGRST